MVFFKWIYKSCIVLGVISFLFISSILLNGLLKKEHYEEEPKSFERLDYDSQIVDQIEVSEKNNRINIYLSFAKEMNKEYLIHYSYLYYDTYKTFIEAYGEFKDKYIIVTISKEGIMSVVQ